MTDLGEDTLIVVEHEPYNAEVPLPILAADGPESPAFFIRNHFNRPVIDAESWRIEIGGEVERPFSLGYQDLVELPYTAVPTVLECAGNGRQLMHPSPPGTPWGLGAYGAAKFGGTPLAPLLGRAGLNPSAVEVKFSGADQGVVEDGREMHYERSLPMERALHPDTLIVWEMNGAPLSAEHGYPARLLVPGWYGMASVKWLTRIEVIAEPFRGYFQSERYIFESDSLAEDGAPVGPMLVRALIGAPLDGAELPFGKVQVAGRAWSGRGGIRRVELSVDGGESWQEADVHIPPSPYAPARWSFGWRPDQPGAYVLAVRATDMNGEAQPLDSRWNAYGYGNNVVQRIRVRVLSA